MSAHHDDSVTRKNKSHVRVLLERRLGVLHRHESKLQDSPLKSYYASQEAILEEVLRRAGGHQDDETLIAIIDLCIFESRCYQRISTDRGLKSWYGIKVRVLRSAKVLIGRYLRLGKWIHRRKK